MCALLGIHVTSWFSDVFIVSIDQGCAALDAGQSLSDIHVHVLERV